MRYPSFTFLMMVFKELSLWYKEYHIVWSVFLRERKQLFIRWFYLDIFIYILGHAFYKWNILKSTTNSFDAALKECGAVYHLYIAFSEISKIHLHDIRCSFARLLILYREYDIRDFTMYKYYMRILTENHPILLKKVLNPLLIYSTDVCTVKPLISVRQLIFVYWASFKAITYGHGRKFVGPLYGKLSMQFLSLK